MSQTSFWLLLMLFVSPIGCRCFCWEMASSSRCSSVSLVSSTEVFKVLVNLTFMSSGSFCLSKNNYIFMYSMIWIKSTNDIYTFSTSKEEHFSSKTENKALFLESLWAKVDKWRMNFVEQNVHQPSKEEGQPANHNHHPDLEPCHWMRVSIYVNQPHIIR